MKKHETIRRVTSLAGVLLALSLPTLAGEVVVKIDSVTNFSQAYIVGDFIQGEQAGARLTSPCSGYIVAVQILWLEGTPGHPPSVEEAIHIYDGSTFPTPGPELELLEGPVMTPGFWNEFRYLDEAQTIPLHVPVTAGQKFYVALEFYNPTDVQHGGPSVVRDIDGYTAGCNVLFGYIPGYGWRWWDFNGFPIYLAGDLAIRAVIDCPDPTGACCRTDGTCQNDVEQSHCSGFGEVWYQGQTCTQITCRPRGACCRQGGCLQLVDPDQCAAIGGVYAGHGTNCSDNVCVAGACCIPQTGECIQNFVFQCITLGGDFLGPGTSCNPNLCPQPLGACCFGQYCIAGQTAAQCTSAGGKWAGAWTDCADHNNNGVADACEVPTVCIGDLNCDHQVDFGDINPFVLRLSNPTLYAATYPGCPDGNGDVNGSGGVGFDDINPFVALLSSAPLPIPCR